MKECPRNKKDARREGGHLKVISYSKVIAAPEGLVKSLKRLTILRLTTAK